MRTEDSRLLLCTDMDRTVIPNGAQSESPHARQRFAEFCADPRVTLVYVTGRHRSLVEEALNIYQLPFPDYVISDVGSKIYQCDMGNWQEMEQWEIEISADWQGKSHHQLQEILRDVRDIRLQESSKQNTHKLSYYVSLHVNEECLLADLSQRLERYGVQASLIWSIDELKGIGLLDILPQNATKLHAVDFLRRTLQYPLEQVVFAGDSGNDLPVMESAIASVLVANASDAIKQSASQLAAEAGHSSALYIATGEHLNMNGNYTAGVLEGVWHFAKPFRPLLEASHE